MTEGERERERERIQKLYKTGKLAIIPIGFRCYTKNVIKEKLSISQPALPFSTGFFTPHAIISVLNNKKISLSYPVTNNNHCVAIKYENFNDPKLGLGIKFTRSNYEQINSLAKDKEQKGINQLLDSTFSYYTIDLENKFVLAHYNWHPFADESKSHGEYDIAKNLATCSDTLNRRIERMFSLCNNAEHIILAFYNRQQYKYLCIDDEVYPLTNFDSVVDAFKNNFDAKVTFIDLDDENCLNKLKNVF